MNQRRAVIVLAMLSAILGCSRPFYRRQADADAYTLTDQKAAVAGYDPYAQFRTCCLQPGCDGCSAAMDRVHPVSIHIVWKT